MTAISSAALDSAADLFRGLAHPVRLRILLALEGGALSPSELAPLLAVQLGLVSYQVHALRDDGLLELVDTRAVRGSVQSFYRLTPRGEWARLLLAAMLSEQSDLETQAVRLVGRSPTAP